MRVCDCFTHGMTTVQVSMRHICQYNIWYKQVVWTDEPRVTPNS